VRRTLYPHADCSFYLCVALPSDGRSRQAIRRPWHRSHWFAAARFPRAGDIRQVKSIWHHASDAGNGGSSSDHRYRVIDARHLAHRRDLRPSNTLVLLGGLGDTQVALAVLSRFCKRDTVALQLLRVLTALPAALDANRVPQHARIREAILPGSSQHRAHQIIGPWAGWHGLRLAARLPELV
jgi:hypothetical protein